MLANKLVKGDTITVLAPESLIEGRIIVYASVTVPVVESSAPTGTSAMIGLSKVIDSSRYGNVISKKQKVLSFEEKNSSRSGWINNGHYIFNKNIFNSWSSSFSLEKELFPLMIKDNSLGAFKVRNDKFIDMGIPADYVKLCKNIKEYE